MNKPVKTVLVLSVVFAGAVSASASETLVLSYDFNTAPSDSGTPYPASFVADQVSASALALGPGLGGYFNSSEGYFTGTSWNEAFDVDSGYISFTATFAEPTQLSHMAFTWNKQSPFSGLDAFVIRTSVDTFASDVFVHSGFDWPETARALNADLTGLGEVLGAAEFRFYTYGDTSTGSQAGFLGAAQGGQPLGLYAIPEPSTVGLLLGGCVLGIAFIRRRIR